MQEPLAEPAVRGWITAVILGGFLVLTATFGRQAADASTTILPNYGGVYREGVVGTPLHLHPVLCNLNAIDRTVCRQLFRGLMKFDSRGAVVPDLAVAHEVSEDGLVHTLRMRPDMFWHDGLRVTAQDAVYTFEVLRDPDFPGDPSLANAARLATVRATDSFTVQFRLEQPFTPFLNLLTVGLLPFHIHSNVAVADMMEYMDQLPVVGNGPMQLERAEDDFLRLVPSRFQDKAVPYIPVLEFRYHASTANLFQAFLDGQLEGLSAGVTENLELLPNRQEMQVFASAQPSLVMVLFNLRSETVPALAELQVRKALLHAVNREAVVNSTDLAWGTPADSPIPAGHWAYKEGLTQYPYDPVRALELFGDSGWRDRDLDGMLDRDGIPLTLSLAVSDDRALRAYAETIAAYWRDLGIGVDLVVLPFVRLLAEQLDNHSFDAALVQVSGLEGDPDPFRFWHSSQTAPGQLNYGGWSNPYADGLMERSRIELDAEERRYLLHRFQDVFLADLPALPISSPIYAYGVHGRVRNVQVGQLNSPAERLDTFANWFIATTRVTIWEDAAGFPR